MKTMEEIRAELIKVYAGDYRGLGKIREARPWLFEQKRELENAVRTAKIQFARVKAEVRLSTLLFEMRMSDLIDAKGRVTALGRPHVNRVQRYETASAGGVLRVKARR
jgi:hypothetical protein